MESENSKIEPRKSGRRWLIIGVGAAAALTLGLLNRRWWVMNDITTGQTSEYPDLPSHAYAADAAATRQASEATCAALPRWRVVPTASAEGESAPLHAEVRTALFNFTDDVTVRFEPIQELPAPGTPARTRVVIRSHSRVGKGDLGENERHIRALQREMDARLPLAGPPQ